MSIIVQQVLSESVSKALVLTGEQEAQETAKFVALIDKFFDILNVSNFTNGTRNRKPFQHPYRHGDDARLTVSLYNTLSKYMPLCTKYYIQWLEEEFLPYLDQWEKSVEAREGFTKTQKKQMLLSSETRLGLRMTGMLLKRHVTYTI